MILLKNFLLKKIVLTTMNRSFPIEIKGMQQICKSRWHFNFAHAFAIKSCCKLSRYSKQVVAMVNCFKLIFRKHTFHLQRTLRRVEKSSQNANAKCFILINENVVDKRFYPTKQLSINNWFSELKLYSFWLLQKKRNAMKSTYFSLKLFSSERVYLDYFSLAKCEILFEGTHSSRQSSP